MRAVRLAVSLRYPSHPGALLQEVCLPGTGLSLDEAAEHLGVDIDALADICQERAPITAEWAVRLAKAFGSSPEVWLGMQMDYDLALAKDEFGALEISLVPELSDEEMDAWERAQEGAAEVAD